jgi:hypothetical protein
VRATRGDVILASVLLGAVLVMGGGLALCGCYSFRTPELVLTRDRAAADLALRDYRRSLPTADQYARAIYCLAEQNLEDLDAGGVDAGGLIACKPPVKAKPIVASSEALCLEGHQCVSGVCSCTWIQDGGAP